MNAWKGQYNTETCSLYIEEALRALQRGKEEVGEAG